MLLNPPVWKARPSINNLQGLTNSSSLLFETGITYLGPTPADTALTTESYLKKLSN